MAEPAKRRATYADLEAVPSHLVAEILDGELLAHPRPTARHVKAANVLSFELTGPFERGVGGPGGWIFMIEPELHLGMDVVVPDICGWRLDRWPGYPERGHISTSPDWVCEILSPSTEHIDRGVKRHVYSSAGISHFWLLDPRIPVLEVFTLAATQWVFTATFSKTDEVSAPPFETIAFSLAALWPFDAPLTDDPQGG
jgi:Uma2 family endonuclease